MNLSGRNNSNPASELEQNLEFLRQTYFFSGIPLEALKVFAYLCTREKFKSGEYIFRQFHVENGKYWLKALNKNYFDVEIPNVFPIKGIEKAGKSSCKEQLFDF